MLSYHLLAAGFALLLPVLLFVSRAVVRQQRSAAFQDVMRSLFPEGGDLPQLDLVGSKYDVPAGPVRPGELRRPKRQSNNIMFAAAIYAALTFIGFELLLVPIGGLVNARLGWPLQGEFSVTQAFLWTTGGRDADALANTVSVVCMAFLGGYIGAARFLVRQALNYELEGMSFVRSSLQLIMGVVIALVAYRASTVATDSAFETLFTRPAATAERSTPDDQSATTMPSQAKLQTASAARGAGEPIATLAPTGTATAPDPDACGPNPCPVAAGAWLGVAFLIGLAPESGLALISRRIRMRVEKSIPDGFFDRVEITPVEIIDGIDSAIAYRLEQNNIEDVQNLATANPIQLYIETPYGLFEVFDWVLQAQLCVVSGTDVFLELKRHGIRTIFDLERAVLADGVPDSYAEAIGEILFKNGNSLFRSRLGGPESPISADIVRHAVAVGGDDLHVQRLRTLWARIRKRSSPDAEAEWLYRRAPLPGDLDFTQAPPA